MKKKIIFVHFNKFLDNFDWKRYEFDKLSKSYEIEVHELLKLTHPDFSYNYQRNDNDLNLKSFSNFNLWKKYIIDQDTTKNLFIFQNFPYTYTSLKCFLLIKKLKFKSAVISINNLPTYDSDKTNTPLYKKIYFKILSAILRPKHALFVLKSIMVFSLSKLFRKKYAPDFFLLGGDNINSKKIIKSYKKYSKIIRINSWDYSYSLRPDKKMDIENEYAVYISDGEARYPSDSYLAGSVRVENSKKLCKAICNFFDRFEKYYNLKVVIASHPRSTSQDIHDKDLGNRPCFKGYTNELIKRSKFIINYGSTSISYATIYKKPVLYIYSKKESYKNISGMRKVNFISKLINSERINIDDFKNFGNLNLTVNEKSYLDFFSDYVCFKKNVSNFEIISNEILKKI